MLCVQYIVYRVQEREHMHSLTHQPNNHILNLLRWKLQDAETEREREQLHQHCNCYLIGHSYALVTVANKQL